MSTEPNNAPVAEDQDAKAAAKARAIERARELAAKRRAEKEAEQAAGNAETGNEQDDEAKAAAKARAIERARELAAQRRAEKEAGNTDAATGNEPDNEAKAAAKARAIERARELAAKRRAEKETGNAETSNEPDDAAKAAAKARAIERARELAAKRRAEKEAGTNEQAVGTAEQAVDTAEQANAQSDAANAGEDDKAAAKAQAIARARELAAKRKAQQAEAQQEEQPSESSGTVEGVLLSGKPKQSSLFEIFLKGIWKDNPGLCQLLGMCPLLAVTTSAANALGLGIATILVLMLSSSAIALIRRLIVPEVRIPIYVIIIAALVTVVRFEVEASFPALYQQLGIYLSLIATNCIIMGRAEAFAGHNGVIRSLVDAIASGIGFTLVLFALGSIREIVGNGTWLVGASDLLGGWAAGWEMQLYGSDYTLLIAILPPGGFFVLAFLIAAKNALDGRAKRKAERKARIDVMRV